METRQINVMGKMVEIAEGATFADVAKDFSLSLIHISEPTRH